MRPGVLRRQRVTRDDLDYFRRVLEVKQKSILDDLGLIETYSMKTTSAESSGDQIYSDHMPDLGSDAMEREKAFMFASRDGAYLEQLDRALTRIQDGSYGVCRVCGVDIARARLEAVPTTRICVSCKEKEQTELDRA